MKRVIVINAMIIIASFIVNKFIKYVYIDATFYGLSVECSKSYNLLRHFVGGTNIYAVLA